MLVLNQCATLACEVLRTEVRSVPGFSRTGAKLPQEIASAIDGLLATGEIAQSATGLRSAGEAPTGMSCTSRDHFDATPTHAHET